MASKQSASEEHEPNAAEAAASAAEDTAEPAAAGNEDDGASTAADAGQQELAALTAEIAKLQETLAGKDEELQSVREGLARARADFANFRRRTQQEQEEQAKFATALLIAEFLPILDNFERALDTIPQELRFFSWLQGVDLVHQMARNVLEKRGLEPIDTHEQPFDPNYHEVVLREGEDDGGKAVVLEELQRGYVMHGRVLRPSLVKVGLPPAAETAAEDSAAGDAASAPATDSDTAPDTEQS